MVAWSGAGRGASQGVFARSFDRFGAPLTGEVRVAGLARGGQREVSIIALPGGGFQAAWAGPWAGGPGLFSRRFDAAGNPLGGAFRADAARPARERQPALAAVGDQVVIAWEVAGGRLDRSSSGVVARRFGPDGSPLGPEFLVNRTTRGDQGDPSVAALADGGFVVAWEGRGAGDRRGVLAREFDADGTPRGDEARVNQDPAGVQANPTVQPLGAGYAVAWDGRVGTAGAPDPGGIALRSTAEVAYGMPGTTVPKDQVMTFAIPGIGVLSEVSPKQITFTNTTSRTIYPILESANNNAVASNANGDRGKGLYDPYDPVNREYRAYIGYKTADGYFLGLRPGDTVTIDVPLVFWDAGRILFASDGANLIPAVDNEFPPPGMANSPNPFNYHNFQNFIVNAAVTQGLLAAGVAPAIVDLLTPLLNQTFEVIDDFKAAARAALKSNYDPIEGVLLNLARSQIPTKRYREDLADGVHAVLWYQGQNDGGLAEGPAGGAPAQLAEMTFRSKIFALPQYLTHKDIDPNGNSGETHDLVNYDVSYVDSMLLPVAIQAINVPLDPNAPPPPPSAPYGWVGADKALGDLQGPLQSFTTANPDRDTNLNGLGNYFGGAGYPKYYIPAATEAATGIKVPAGQNLALESPITDGRSAWDQNEFILTSAGVGPINVDGTGRSESSAGGFALLFDDPNDVAALKQVTPAAGWSFQVDNVPAAGNQVLSTTFSTVGNQEVAVVAIQAAVAPGLHSITFRRPVDDVILRTLANLWLSWADHYYDLTQGVTPAAAYSGTIAPESNELVFAQPVPADQLVVGMPVSGPGMAADLQATILGIETVQGDPTRIRAVALSKLSVAGGSGDGYAIGKVRQIRPQNDLGFPIQTYALGFTNPADPTYDLRFARAVYTVLDSMNTIPVDGPTTPAIVKLMANSLGGNLGLIPNIGVSVDPAHPSNATGNLLSANVIRDAVKSILRGVDDFQVDAEDQGRWYPDPSLTGAATGQTINGAPADFNLYNLNPFVWFVHKNLGLSGYGFSLDDDAADVGADGASQLHVVIGSLDPLAPGQFYKAEWTHGAPFGPVKINAGTISTVQGGDYDKKSQITGLDTSPLRVVLQVLGKGSSGEAGALVSGPGITPGTRVLFANVGGDGVILDKPATAIPGATGPYYFTGTPPKVAVPPAATPSSTNAWNLAVLGGDGFYGEPSLSYTWSLVSGPAGSGATFSANGSNAAKQTRVKLGGVPGTYVLRVAIAQPADAGGFATTADVAVTIPPAARPTVRRRGTAPRARQA